MECLLKVSCNGKEKADINACFFLIDIILSSDSYILNFNFNLIKSIPINS